MTNLQTVSAVSWDLGRQGSLVPEAGQTGEEM